MPEHVVHPERFTVYELEEPLTIGAGEHSANPAQEGSQVRELMSSSTASGFLCHA